jgi:hypothetical protein
MSKLPRAGIPMPSFEGSVIPVEAEVSRGEFAGILPEQRPG